MIENKELMLRCQCGDEVLVIDKIDDIDDEYFISFRSIPKKGNWWSKIGFLWRCIKHYPHWEIALSSEQINILVKWIKESEDGKINK